jgi:hypothetical protein
MPNTIDGMPASVSMPYEARQAVVRRVFGQVDAGSDAGHHEDAYR